MAEPNNGDGTAMATEETVITPGGPRRAEIVHRVGPTEVVTTAGTGEPLVAAVAPGAAAAGAGAQYVVTPGGRRHPSLVNLVPDGAIIDAHENRLRLLHPTGELIADLGSVEVRGLVDPLMPGHVVHPPAAVPGLGTGWITNSGWTNGTGKPISHFATTFRVPPAPTTNSGQVIFIFPGIQNSGYILQPVLQWGPSAAGGGAYWSVASWYVGGPGGSAFHTNLVRVNVGDTLVGVMDQTGHQAGTNNYSYSCFFSGIANTTLTMTNIEQLTWANETLECYGLTQDSDYPDSFMTRMASIDLRTGTTHPAITWSPQNRVTDIGQHTVIVSNSSSSGEVDLCYRATQQIKAQGLAAFNGRLVASWKGIPFDDRLFYSQYNGSTWSPQSLGPSGSSRAGTSLAVFNGRLYAAWKGQRSDQRLFFSSFDGTNWAAQAQIPGVGSRVGPTLAVFNGRLYAAWRGVDSDQAIWYASFDGTHWSSQAFVPGVASSIGPSIASFNGRLYAAWKGAGLDQAIWYASFDGTHWSAQATIPGVASSMGPSLAGWGGRLYAAWKGLNDDQAIWYSSYDGAHWSPQASIPGVGSSIGPVLTTYGGGLHAMWKGIFFDNRLFHSSFDGSHWAPQSLIPGNSGPDYEGW